MASGREVFRRIQGEVDAAQRECDRIGAEVETLHAEQSAARSREAQAIAELARVRLDELAAGRIASGLDQADQRARELLDARARAREQLTAQLAASIQRQDELEAERERACATLDAARAVHDELVESTLETLRASDEHAEQAARVERVAQQAAHAASKAQQAEADRDRKRVPYEKDKLFSYLWRRRYGYPEYRAWRPTRVLDGWVARLCRYETEHRDYEMLLEIPTRLRAHADTLTAEAEAEAQRLAALESSALQTAGVPERARTLAATERQLENVARRIDDAERDEAEVRAELAELDGGGDRFTKEALLVLSEQLAGEEVARLREEVHATSTHEDDVLVRRIGEQRAAIESLEPRVEQLRHDHARALDRLRDVQEFRRRFRNHGYDAANSTFSGDFDVGDVLGGLLRGAFVLGDAWLRVGRHQRFRRRGRSSSADIALGVLKGMLSSSSRGGGGGFGGFGGGGGGFRGGGGFGGGGFKTGGGF